MCTFGCDNAHLKMLIVFAQYELNKLFTKLLIYLINFDELKL